MHSDNTGELLMSAARSLRHAFAASLEQFEVTPGQARALRVVCEEQQVRPSALAASLRIAPRSATDVIDGLEARGLVQRSPDPADRRATIVSVTDEGRRLRERIEQVRVDSAERLLAGIADRDRRTLDRVLRALVDKER